MNDYSLMDREGYVTRFMTWLDALLTNRGVLIISVGRGRVEKVNDVPPVPAPRPPTLRASMWAHDNLENMRPRYRPGRGGKPG